MKSKDQMLCESAFDGETWRTNATRQQTNLLALRVVSKYTTLDLDTASIVTGFACFVNLVPVNEPSQIAWMHFLQGYSADSEAQTLLKKLQTEPFHVTTSELATFACYLKWNQHEVSACPANTPPFSDIWQESAHVGGWRWPGSLYTGRSRCGGCGDEPPSCFIKGTLDSYW